MFSPSPAPPLIVSHPCHSYISILTTPLTLLLPHAHQALPITSYPLSLAGSLSPNPLFLLTAFDTTDLLEKSSLHWLPLSIGGVDLTSYKSHRWTSRDLYKKHCVRVHSYGKKVPSCTTFPTGDCESPKMLHLLPCFPSQHSNFW